MPAHPENRDYLDEQNQTLGADALTPMFGLARRAQAAMADATLANLKEVLSTAQQVVETARTVTREASEKPPVSADQAAAMAPALKSMAERNMKAFEEMTNLAQKCTRSYLDLPSQLAGCRSPQEVLGLQMKFWQGAAADCAESGRRVMNALAGQPGTHIPTVGEILGQRQASSSPADRSSLREASQAVAAAEAAEGKRGPDGRRAA